jgi:hypothetical protein
MIVTLGLKVVALSFLLFVSHSVASEAVGLADPTGLPQTDVLMYLLLVSSLNAAVLSYTVIRSRWSGWRLILTIFFVFYGITTFLSQIETIVFLSYLQNIVPSDIIPKLFMQGIITAAIVSPLAVAIHGKIRDKEVRSAQLLIMPFKERLWKLILISIIYVMIYVSFGMFVFIPLAGNAFQEYYGNLQLPVWIFPFQMLRGIIWVALALPVIQMMKSRRDASLAVALLFSVLMGSQLLIPNELMPDRIRLSHFVEVTSSNFLFGLVVVWLLTRHRGIRHIHK